jgi:hypothetical protein
VVVANCIARSFIPCTLAKYNLNGQVNEDQMGRACSMNGARNTCNLLVGNPE